MRRNKAQVASEYAILIFVVAGAIVAMTFFLKRALQARAQDARRYMMFGAGTYYEALLGKLSPDVPSKIPVEYEPYYAQVNMAVERNLSRQSILEGRGTTGDSKRIFNDSVKTTAPSTQLPVRAAD